MTPLALDTTVAVVILLSAAIAAYRGLIREVFSIVALASAVFVTYKGGALLVPRFNDWFGVGQDVSKSGASHAHLVMGILSPELAAKLSAYGSAFLFIFVVMSLIGFFISRAVNEAGLGALDRVFGAAFGAARGFLIVFLIYFGCTYLITYNKLPDWVTQSKSVPVLEQARLWTNKEFKLDQRIEDQGGQVAIKIGKFDPDSLNDVEPAAGQASASGSSDKTADKPQTPHAGLRQDERGAPPVYTQYSEKSSGDQLP